MLYGKNGIHISHDKNHNVRSQFTIVRAIGLRNLLFSYFKNPSCRTKLDIYVLLLSLLVDY